ncbi:hypothetical protein COLO4_07616 [Corchorus olitorius]|uniref:Uncharacterized protein n=1 Tax=Corchorus olitorius TaxID=93759 RepID=A0A1R3KJ39_9ROSI|nr:hypothetical protein COLO4_07616 [Corchorus olitorius]
MGSLSIEDGTISNSAELVVESDFQVDYSHESDSDSSSALGSPCFSVYPRIIEEINTILAEELNYKEVTLGTLLIMGCWISPLSQMILPWILLLCLL